jgi:Fur family transcriptional regulator, ferric uptake regulator
MATADLDDTVAQRLRSINQRYTTGRRALVGTLRDAGQPVSIPEILATDTKVAQSSAYRNLAVLELAGVVHRIATVGDFARYELAEDLTEHHHHMICTSCGNVEDFTVPASLERTLRRVTGEVAGESGFQPAAHRLDLVGVCADCA